MDTLEELKTEQLDDRSEFIKRLEAIDPKNLSPKDEKFLYDSVQDYFIKNFPVDQELVDRIPQEVSILDQKAYLEEFYKDEQRNRAEQDEALECPAYGFYDEIDDHCYVNADSARNAAHLFSTIFHECLHFISINQGAGFNITPYMQPDEINQLNNISEEEKQRYTDEASVVLVEGATKIIEQTSLDDMGLDISEDDGYIPEIQIMTILSEAITKSYEQFLDAYFRKSTEDIRKIIELNLLPKDERANYEYGNIPTGEFAACLINIGAASESMKNFYFKEDRQSYFEVLNNVDAAAQYYVNLAEENRDA